MSHDTFTVYYFFYERELHMKQLNYLATALLALATVSAEIIAKVHHIKSSEQLEEMLDKNDNVVVKFYAEWCGPCKQFNPIFEKVAKEMSNVVFASVDGDDNRDIIKDYKVTGFPTVLYFKAGDQVGKGKKRDASGFK